MACNAAACVFSGQMFAAILNGVIWLLFFSLSFPDTQFLFMFGACIFIFTAQSGLFA